MAKILVFGDSIAWGAFDTEMGGWVERLKVYFLKNYAESWIGVYNFAVSNNNTQGVLHFLESDILKMNYLEKEDYVLLFSIGSNDFIYKNPEKNPVVSIEEFEANIHKIISVSKKYSDKVIFTGFCLIDESKTMPWEDSEYFWEIKSLIEYEDSLKKICKEENITFIPLFNLLEKDDLYDGLHPNTDGHIKIFEIVLDKLQMELKL